MATSFKGLYLCPPKQPRPSHVQVGDAEQDEMKLSLEEYEARGGQPPWQSLPWQSEKGLIPDDGDKHGPEISM
ncbi:hypothetical protein [Methylobacterium sp. E-045]|uniref:hypothetical protein n=1 Tax=Methylobacterium sp. E-045 TaxID=2836575 RepID=UPI001FBA0F26|nr:hypothetical protein [Methylobacterium sp. E-045]MCJ2127377.1 hypothetical protein [Methylobacterium sp. E-045]